MSLDRLREGRGDISATSMALASTVMGNLPAYLTGALAVQVSRSLGLTESAIGLAASAFFLTSALASYPGGRLTERIGPERGMLVAVGAAVAGLLTMGLVARSYPVFMLGVMLGGAGNGLVQPAANLALARKVRRHRQGVAFGIKQAAIPIASLLGGIAVPTVALTLGWRWAFAGAGTAGLVLAIALWRARVERAPDAGGRDRPRLGRAVRPLILLAAGGGMASGAVNSMGAFLVLGGVASGLSPGTAGILLAVSSAACISTRIGFGWVADRRGSPLGVLIVALLSAGGLAFATLATQTPPWLYALAAVVGYGLGWAWPGLYTLAVVRAHPEMPGAATGLTQVGIYTGGAIGPAGFGFLVEHVSFSAAWAAAAVSVCAAAAIVGSQLGTGRPQPT